MTLDDTLRALVADLVREELAKQQAATAPDLMTTAEAAGHARVAPETIRRWIRDGRLREHRAGREVRVSRADLETMLRVGVRRRKPTPRARELTPEELAAARFR